MEFEPDHGFTEKMTYIEKTRHYYPEYDSQGYILYGNLKRPLDRTEMQEIRKRITGAKIEWDSTKFELTGELVVAFECDARWDDGTIDKTMVPVFAKYKKVE